MKFYEAFQMVKIIVLLSFLPCLLGFKFGPSAGKFSQGCSTNLQKCPAGHFMVRCANKEEGHQCKQCAGHTFQPNTNKLGDKCRLRKVCNNREFMTYRYHGSPTEDADCKCQEGYHFVSNDQRACVPNDICKKGLGQGPYGECENCFKKKMYSDRADKYQSCKPLTNCEKDNRCTVKRSNGTFNNVCGPKVKDVSKCENASSSNQGGTPISPLHWNIFVGSAVAGVFVILVVLLLLYIWYRRRQLYGRNVEDPLTENQFKKLMDRIIERSGEDESYCKKVMNAAFRDIEDRIDRQKWGLAQELFRNHYQPAKYEVIVETYKDKESKYAVNGYLQDWREYKGENSEAVEHLFHCLKQCGREDIVYEICNKFREGYPEVVIDAETQLQNGVVRKRQPKPSFGQTLLKTIFPCSSCGKKQKQLDVEKQENIETKDKLLKLDCQSKEEEAGLRSKEAELHAQEAGAIFRERPSPSAPVIDETGNVHIVIPFNRAMSYPIQASS